MSQRLHSMSLAGRPAAPFAPGHHCRPSGLMLLLIGRWPTPFTALHSRNTPTAAAGGSRAPSAGASGWPCCSRCESSGASARWQRRRWCKSTVEQRLSFGCRVGASCRMAARAACSSGPDLPATSCRPHLLACSLIFPVIIFCVEFFSLRRHIHRCAQRHGGSGGCRGLGFDRIIWGGVRSNLGQQRTQCAAPTGLPHQPPPSRVSTGHQLCCRDDIRPGIIESGWRSALTLMLFDSFMVTSHGARVAVLAFMFLVR